ncbi:MAG: hypothetical protein R3C14_51165 [Caldilineaceae bacterium]
MSTPALASSNQQPTVLDERTKRMIAGAVAEIDPAQIALLRTLTPAERFRQMMSMIKFMEKVGVIRLREREPELDEAEALQIVRNGTMLKRAMETRWLNRKSLLKNLRARSSIR